MLQPVSSFLLVKPVEEKKKEKTTNTGIIFVEKTDTVDLQIGKGEIISIGPEVKNYKEGQIVYYNYFSGNRLMQDEQEYHLVLEMDILAIDR